MSLRRVCVFCGSSVGASTASADATRRLGNEMAERSIGLVFGGASVGLMGILADTMLSAGGDVIGVMPHAIAELEIAHPRVGRLELVDTMHERKRQMYELSDAFICAPGGLGTLDEFAEISTWRQLGLHDKPIGMLNTEA